MNVQVKSNECIIALKKVNEKSPILRQQKTIKLLLRGLPLKKCQLDNMKKVSYFTRNGVF